MIIYSHLIEVLIWFEIILILVEKAKEVDGIDVTIVVEECLYVIILYVLMLKSPISFITFDLYFLQMKCFSEANEAVTFVLV